MQSYTQSYTQLSQEYTIPTPENVSFGYEVVGIGNRFIATLFDSAILLLLFVAINLLLAFALDLVGAFSTGKGKHRASAGQRFV